jgi:acyl-coenzyme A synthetase/AMP-(fatty) acid ligase
MIKSSFTPYHVELGEIRQALNQHILIQDSVIILHKDQHQRETLAAYYLAKQELDSIELRKFLAQSILEETLPNTFIYLTHIP